MRAYLITLICFFGGLIFSPLLRSSELASNLLLEEPIHAFCLPIFSDSGRKAWDLRGKDAYYLENGQLRVVDMVLRSYAEAVDEAITLTICSPEAIIDLGTSTASGEGVILLYGNGYRIVGRDWKWRGKEKRVIINQGVEVVLQTPITPTTKGF